MVGEMEQQDRREARLVVIALGVLVLVGLIAALIALPALADFHSTQLAPGLGLKGAAIASFVVTFVTFVIFAVAAGDGLIGELQFMLLGFFAFFLILWLLIAWIL